jgi:hypothetical protein
MHLVGTLEPTALYISTLVSQWVLSGLVEPNTSWSTKNRGFTESPDA